MKTRPFGPWLGLLGIVALLFSSCAPAPRPLQKGDDFFQIQQSGQLRILVWPQPVRRNHQPEPLGFEQELAQDLAYSLGLEPVVEVETSFAAMLQKLQEGKADLIAARPPGQASYANLPVLPTISYYLLDLGLVTKKGQAKNLAGLAGAVLCLPQPSFAAEHWQGLPTAPGLKVQPLPAQTSSQELLEKVAAGTCQAALFSSLAWAELQAGHPQLERAHRLSPPAPAPMLVRQASLRLHQKANHFLYGKAMGRRAERLSTSDLGKIKQRGVLRLLTRPNSQNFFVAKGEQQGFEYELVRQFAEQHKLRLEVVVPSYHSELLAWLNAGKGDLVAASMSVTDQHEALADFTPPYQEVEELVVVHKDNRSIKSLQDLKRKRVHLRKSSSYFQALSKQAKEGMQFEFLAENIETEDSLDDLAQGKIEVTLADASLVQAKMAAGAKIKPAFVLGKTQKAWAVRKSNPALKAALSAFIQTGSRSGMIKMQKEKFFKSQRQMANRTAVLGRITPYDQQLQLVADKYNFDWKLIASQMFQESRFDPHKKSSAGALGLLQVMPATAKELGLKDPSQITDPLVSMELGIKYLSKLFERFDDVPQLKDRVYFALASYNAGYYHVQDARLLAHKEGLDPDLWYDNVEHALSLLERPEYYKKAKYGYCRGWEPIRYVAEIQNRYNVYVEHVPDANL